MADTFGAKSALAAKLHMLWLSGHSPKEAFAITHYGMSRAQQDAGFGERHIAQFFATWERISKEQARQIMAAELARCRDMFH